VAVLAFRAPRRAFIRRKNAPQALWLGCRAAAAKRSAVAAPLAQDVVRRLRIWPPETRWGGQRPNHDVKCFTVGQRLISTPISLRMPKDVVSSRPSRWLKSTPGCRCRRPGRGRRAGSGPVCVAAAGRDGLEIGFDLAVALRALLMLYVIAGHGLS